MKKDSFYFPHDSNAKDDPKCVLLIEQLGMEGYGIFWMLIEVLREQPEYKYPLKLMPALARRYNTTSEKIRAVVCGYDLFTIEKEEFFFSVSLKERMKPMEEKRLLASKAGKASAERRKIRVNATDVQQTFNECSTTVQPKEKKIKEKSIEEESIKKASPNVSLSDRTQNFKDELTPFVEQYGKDMIRAFFDWWSEPNPAKTKMRFEMQKTWSTAGRLRTWERRSNEKR